MFRAAVLIVLFLSTASAATKAIRFKTLWDGHRVIPNAVVVVDGDKVRSVEANGKMDQTKIPADAAVIDLRRYHGIPGMIDSHTHITYFWNGAPGTTPRRQPRRHTAVTVFLAQENARRTLEAGVTTIRDLNARDNADIDMRDLIQLGAMTGPRMFVSGAGFTTALTSKPTAITPFSWRPIFWPLR